MEPGALSVPSRTVPGGRRTAKWPAELLGTQEQSVPSFNQR